MGTKPTKLSQLSNALDRLRGETGFVVCVLLQAAHGEQESASAPPSDEGGEAEDAPTADSRSGVDTREWWVEWTSPAFGRLARMRHVLIPGIEKDLSVFRDDAARIEHRLRCLTDQLMDWIGGVQGMRRDPEFAKETSALRAELEELAIVVRAASGQVATTPRVVHATDFSWLLVNDERFDFPGPNQRGVIRILFREWEKGGDGAAMHQDSIGEEIDPEANRSRFRVEEVFRGHPALDTILRRRSPGVWALYLSPAP